MQLTNRDGNFDFENFPALDVLVLLTCTQIDVRATFGRKKSPHGPHTEVKMSLRAVAGGKIA